MNSTDQYPEAQFYFAFSHRYDRDYHNSILGLYETREI